MMTMTMNGTMINSYILSFKHRLRAGVFILFILRYTFYMPHSKKNTYVCFLRAINVGGNNVIKMDRLKQLFEELNFSSVTTHIQSGNVIFEAFGTESELKKKIEKKIRPEFKNEVVVAVVKMSVLKNLIRKNPFTAKKSGKNAKEYVIILCEELSQKPKLPVVTKDKSYELLYLNGAIGLLLRKDKTKGDYKSYKLLMDQSVPVLHTVRNWNVIEDITQRA